MKSAPYSVRSTLSATGDPSVQALAQTVRIQTRLHLTMCCSSPADLTGLDCLYWPQMELARHATQTPSASLSTALPTLVRRPLDRGVKSPLQRAVILPVLGPVLKYHVLWPYQYQVALALAARPRLVHTTRSPYEVRGTRTGFWF